MVSDFRFKNNKFRYKELLYMTELTALIFSVFFFSFLIIRFPQLSARGVKNGIEMCLNILIPSLYPFMVLSSVLLNSGVSEREFNLLNRLTARLFRLPGSAFGAIVFSMVGGFPVGASLIKKLLNKKLITYKQGSRMMLFCVNAGPAFVIGAVGSAMYGSTKTGIIIYASLIFSSVIVGLGTSLLNKDEVIFNLCKSEKKNNTNVLQQSVKESCRSMLIICGWILMFSCIIELLGVMHISGDVYNIICCFLEVTRGSNIAAEFYSIPFTAAVIAFGGISTHFQVFSILGETEIKYRIFLLGRILNALLTYTVCSILLKIFPIVNETFSAGIKPSESKLSGSLVVSALMILMSVIFIIGDNYILINKKT